MWFEEFQDDRHSGHLGYLKGMILALLNLYVALMLCIKFWLNLTYSLGGFGYWNGTILAILNLHVARMLPIKLQLNQTYKSGGDVENVKS